MLVTEDAGMSFQTFLWSHSHRIHVCMVYFYIFVPHYTIEINPSNVGEYIVRPMDKSWDACNLQGEIPQAACGGESRPVA